MSLQCFQRLGYFPTGAQVPDVVLGHVRRCLELTERMILEAGERTAVWQRELVRERVGAVFDPERARTVAVGAIRSAAELKNHPPDLINLARGGERALELARTAVEGAGGFESELADIESVAAHHANHYMPLVARQMRRDRATLVAFARTVELEATSADRSVLDALEHALSHQHLTRDLIPDHAGGVPLELSFASEQWQRLIRAREHPVVSIAGISRHPCSRIWPRSSAREMSRSKGLRRTRTGPPGCWTGRSATRCSPSPAPRRACPPPPRSSSTACERP